MTTKNNRKYDVVVFGATSSVGVEIVKLLAAKSQISWAIAGRSVKPLEAIAANAAKISGGSPPDIIIADVKDTTGLIAMAEVTTVLLTSVGPYAKFGEPVIEACITAKTDYVDITGEVPWVDKMKKKHGAAAKAAGVRILSFCGYDSIPSEFGVFLAAKELKENGGASFVESFHEIQGGGFPTGTVETIILGVSESFRKLTGKGRARTEKPAWVNNEGLVPDSEKKALSRSMPGLLNILSWSSQAKVFTPCHFMAAINTPVVHGTAGNLGYGGFTYSERLLLTKLKYYQSPLTLFGLIPALLTLFFIHVSWPVYCDWSTPTNQQNIQPCSC